MKKATKPVTPRKRPRRSAKPLRLEYDFQGGVRGKYADRFAKSPCLVMLDPEIASQFRSEREVNRALREYLRLRSK